MSPTIIIKIRVPITFTISINFEEEKLLNHSIRLLKSSAIAAETDPYVKVQ